MKSEHLFQQNCQRLVCLCILFLLSALSAPCWAGGGQHYPNGAEDIMSGVLPPPGVYLKNYLTYINKNKLMDNNGNEAAADLKADVVAEVPRVIWVTPYTALGASWAMQAFVPMYWANVNVKAGGSTVTDSDDKGLGDIIFSPLVLGWHFGPNFHLVSAIDIYAPTGDYDKNEAATQLLSRNHWTFEPVVAMSYTADPVDLSIKFMYDFHSENDDLHLEPGQEFHFDWAAGYNIMKDLTVGGTGFCYWQTTDDKVAGTRIKDERSQLYGIGPLLKWWPNKGRYSATLKHLTEFQGKNIAQGNTTWLNIIWAF